MIGRLNLVALIVALGASLAAVGGLARVAPAPARPEAADGAGYRRVACLLAHLDAAALEIADPERLIAVSAHDRGLAAHRLGERPRIAGLDALESLIALRPDAVLVSAASLGDARAARLREAGVAVLDAGEARGVATLLPAIALLGRVFAAPERAERLAASFQRRLSLVAARVPASARRGGIYVATWADRLFGGTVGTSYHDVLTAAGIDDLAAGRWRGWPEYAVEELIALDPPLIVTKRGMGEALRRLPGLGGLRAFADPAGVIELDAALLDDAGLGMLDAAEALCDAAYPPR